MTYRNWIVVAVVLALVFAAAPSYPNAAYAAVGKTTLNGKPLQSADYVTVAKVTRYKAPVHVKAYSSSAKITTLKRGEEYPVLRVAKYHYQVQLLGGKKGWIRKSYVSTRKAPRYVTGWNYGGGTEQFKAVSQADAIDVVMPRYFRLDAAQLTTVSVDPAYVAWAHSQGKKVWAMIGNGFDVKLTDRILTSSAERKGLVAKLANAVKTYNLDGINVDFENMDIANREEFVAFVDELDRALNKLGAVTSVDVTRTNPDPFWSGSYDRAGLGREADFVILMGYDEYYTGRGAAGSVASMPWVEEGVKLLLDDVPAHKVLLGVPFYTRAWTEPAGGGRATSQDVFMKDIDRWIADNRAAVRWDAEAKQNYAEYTDSKGRHRLWVEDRTSMSARWKLARDYSLGGVAAWAIGQSSNDIWSVFQ